MIRPTFCRGTGESTDKCGCLRCPTPQQLKLTAEHTTDKAGAPMIDISGLPRLGAVLYPNQVRQLARQLNQIANDADQGAKGVVEYPSANSDQ